MEVSINLVAVVVSVIAALVIGSLWYGPVFGKKWMRLAGLTQEGMKSMKMTALQAMIGAAITSFLIAYVLAHIIVFAGTYTGMTGMSAGFTAGFWCWLGFMLPATSGAFLFEGKSWKLWALNAGYYLVLLLVVGGILGAWPAA